MFRDRIRVRAVTWGAARALLAGLCLAAPIVASAAGSTPKLLMLPIVVHSAEAPEYVQGGLADMLGARFGRIGAVELIQVSDPEAATSDADEARAAARRAGADYVLFGSFTRFGKGASLDVQCAPASGDVLREPLREIFVHSGSIGEIIPDLDALAGKVSRFARGELVESDGPAGLAPRLGSGEIEELTRRVAALEAALEELTAEDISGGEVVFESVEAVEVDEVDIVEGIAVDP